MFVKTYAALAAVLLLAAIVFVGAGDAASAKGPLLVAAFGKANIGGEELIVHTVSVVPNGRSAESVAAESLANQGAKPISRSDFSLNGLVRDDNPGGVADAAFNYNNANDPLGGASTGPIDNGLTAWDSITDQLSVPSAGTTLNCPSLVKECPGRQVRDGQNDVGWVSIKGNNTLGVTWYNTSTMEADIAFDTGQPWSIDGATGTFDVFSVAIHEFGHALGLGHSEENDTVMAAYYGGVVSGPGADDVAGILAIYDPGEPEPTPTPAPPGDVVSVSADVNYSTSGRRGRDLIIEVAVSDNNGDAVTGASVSISVDYEGSLYGTGGPSSTDSNGTVRWRVRNAASGEWSTTVDPVVSGSLPCENCPYTESFIK